MTGDAWLLLDLSGSATACVLIALEGSLPQHGIDISNHLPGGTE